MKTMLFLLITCFCCSLHLIAQQTRKVSQPLLINSPKSVWIPTDTCLALTYYFEEKKGVRIKPAGNVYILEIYNDEGLLIEDYYADYVMVADTHMFEGYVDSWQMVEEIHHRFKLVKTGPYRKYKGNRKISVSGYYAFDKKHGVWNYYGENGSIAKQEIYNYGEPIK